MGIISSIKVVQLALGLCLLLVPESSASLCAHRRQYWHEVKERCVNCTQCQAGQIVMRPCQVHRDAQCGPISELNIDWSFLTRSAQRQRANWDRGSQEPEVKRSRLHGVHQHQHHHKNHHSNHEINLFDHKSLQIHPKVVHSHHALHTIKQGSFEIAGDIDTTVKDSPRVLEESSVQPPESASLRRLTVPALEVKAPVPVAPFSAVEELVWDWQVVVLVLAVFACLLFFLVTGIYSIYHARHWHRFKVNFESDVEEAYARRSLMVPGSAEPHAVPTPLDPYASRQGLCMDQLLVRKKQEDVGTEKGNFYIVRDKSKMPRDN